MSLFSLKKHSLSLSLSFSSKALSLSFFDMLCFGCRFVFFFLSFRALLFVLGERSRVLVFSLSFFPSRGDRKPHHPFVSLSLSTKRARFGKPDLPLECSAAHKKREGRSSLRKKINSRAKAGKKRWIGFLLIAAREPQPQESSRVKDENAYIREQICVTFRPPPRGMPPKFILPPVALIYIYMCVYILSDLFDKRVRIYICALLCSKTHEYKL